MQYVHVRFVTPHERYLTTVGSIGSVLVQSCTSERWSGETSDHLQYPVRTFSLGVSSVIQYPHYPLDHRISDNFHRLLTFFIAILWECVHGTSAATQITSSVVAGVSALLFVTIMSNSDWESLPRIHSLASKMERMEGLAVRAGVSVATRLRSFSRSISQTTSSMGWRIQRSGSDHPQRPMELTPGSPANRSREGLVSE